MRIFFSGDEEVCKRHLPVVQTRANEFAKLTEKRGLKQNAFTYSFDDTGAVVRGAYVFGQLSVSIDAPLVKSDPEQRVIRTERKLYEWNTVHTGESPTAGGLGVFLLASGVLRIKFGGSAYLTVKGEVLFSEIDFSFNPAEILSGSGISGGVTVSGLYTLDLAVGSTAAGWQLILVNFDLVYDNTGHEFEGWDTWLWYRATNVALTNSILERRAVDNRGDFQNSTPAEYSIISVTEEPILYTWPQSGQPADYIYCVTDYWQIESWPPPPRWKPGGSTNGSLLFSQSGTVTAGTETIDVYPDAYEKSVVKTYRDIETTVALTVVRRNKDKTTTQSVFMLYDATTGPQDVSNYSIMTRGEYNGEDGWYFWQAFFGVCPMVLLSPVGDVIITASQKRAANDPLPAYNYFAKGLGAKTWIAGYDSTVLGTISEHVVTAQDEPITLVKLNDGSGRFFKVLLFAAAEIKTLLSFNSVSGTTNCFFFYSPNLDLVVVRDAEAGNGIYRLVGDAYVQIQNGFDDLEPVYIAKDGTCVATKTNIYINGSAIEIPPVECVGVFWDHLHYVDRISVSQFAIKTMAGEVVTTTEDGLYNFYELADDSSFAVFSKYYVSVEDDQTTDVALIIDFVDGPLKFETTDTKVVQHIDPTYYLSENYDYYGYPDGIPFGRRYKAECSCFCGVTGTARTHAIYTPPQTWGKRLNRFGYFCELCVETDRIIPRYFDGHDYTYKHLKALCMSYSDAFNKRQVDGFPSYLRVHKHFWHPSIGYLERLIDTLEIIPIDLLHQITEQTITVK